MAQTMKKPSAGRGDGHITFIVGDARSKQNISRIRSHASKAPKLDLKVATATAMAVSRRGSSKNRRTNSYHHHHHHHHPRGSKSPCPASSSPIRLPKRLANKASSMPALAPATSDWRRSLLLAASPRPISADIRLSPERLDDRLVDASGRAARAAAYDYYNTRRDSRSTPTASSPSASSSSSPAFSSLSSSVTEDCCRTSRLQQPAAALVRLPGVHDLVSCACERCSDRDWLWQRGCWQPSPSPPLVLSCEQRDFEEALHRTTAFYTWRFDNKWGPMLAQNGKVFDSEGRIGTFYESFLTTAALIEAGRASVANSIIQRNLSVVEELFVSEHPGLYHLLVVMALDPSPTVFGQTVRQFAQAMVPIARKTFGDDHPYTKLLLSTKLPAQARSSLQKSLLRLLHELSVKHFGDHHLQTCERFFVYGRVLASDGQTDDALDVLAWIQERWESQFGINSMLALWVLLDKASLYLGAGIADVRTELFLSDALRRIKILHANTTLLALTERRKQLGGITNLEVGALRAYGRLNILRRNFGAALESYRQAATLAEEIFGADSPASQIARGDLDRAHESRLMTAWQADYSPGTEEERVEQVHVGVGVVERSRVPFGREPVKVPLVKAPVYGLMPYENVRWREGM